MESTNIIFSGVGGQGIILAGRIVAQCAFEEGWDVKSNELHGMAQREGSVICHVRFGKEVHSPLISKGQADFLLAMEELEGMRYLYYLKPHAGIILNKRQKKPSAHLLKSAPYPENIKSEMNKLGFKVDEINAIEIARNLGNVKIENSILLGALSRYLPFSKKTWENVIQKSVPVKTIEINLKGFEQGYQFSESQIPVEESKIAGK